MKRAILGTTFIVGLSAGTAFADSFSDAIVKAFVDEGYTSIEVKNGPTQTKVEAVKGNQEIEVVYSRADGSVITQEVSTANGDDTPGVQVATSDSDFVDGDEDDDTDETDDTDESDEADDADEADDGDEGDDADEGGDADEGDDGDEADGGDDGDEADGGDDGGDEGDDGGDDGDDGGSGDEGDDS